MAGAVIAEMNMQNEKIKIEDGLTHKIIGCAMKIHSALGNGFQEVISFSC
jgi:hypothetical protein